MLYPFGFGLSYTEFEIKTEKAEITEGTVKLSVSVKISVLTRAKR